MRLVLAQINPTVGDVSGNSELVIRGIKAAREADADLVVFPELCISGYPPKDLLSQEGFVSACAAAVKRIGEKHTEGLTAIIGCPLPADRDDPRAGLANSLVVYRDNAFVDYHDKRLLPTYDVFDEDRYFEPGDRTVVIDVAGAMVGLAICEDLWKGEDTGFSSRYRDRADPMAELARAGARIVVVPSASPFVLNKGKRHHELLERHAREHDLFVASVNQVGGNDDLVFDGHSTVHAPGGGVIAAGKGFATDLIVCDLDRKLRSEDVVRIDDPRMVASAEELVYDALVLGVRDYLGKTGFTKAAIGLSGGIDSALTAVIAVAALGAENVTGLAMPGKYSSDHSVSDAVDLAERLGIRCPVAPIASAFDGFRGVLDGMFGGLDLSALGAHMPDLTEENLQSRVRGTIMMALSNRSGALVLTTGNKSETAVGYCTLYGDMNGGLAVLSDVSKLLVYRLSRWVNEHARRCGFGEVPIPTSTLEKEPSAELAPDQKDSDSLPAYEVLDEIIERHVEGRQGASTVVSQTGFDAETVARVIRLIAINEYKRKQLAVGLKVTSVAFGQGRRMPIAQGWRSA